jgi:hypothetical protein
MTSEGSLPYAQEPARGLYPQPPNSRSCPRDLYPRLYVLKESHLKYETLIARRDGTLLRKLFIESICARKASVSPSFLFFFAHRLSFIATGYRLDEQGVGVRVPEGGTNFHFSMSSTQPPIQWVLGSLSPWVKRPEREADHWILSRIISLFPLILILMPCSGSLIYFYVTKPLYSPVF